MNASEKVSSPPNDRSAPTRYRVSIMDRIGGNRPVRLYLVEWREYRGYTQERLADLMETTKGTISKKEASPQKVDTEWIARFAHGLNVEPEDLYHDPNRPTFNDLLRQNSRDIDPADQDRVISIISTFRKAS